MPVTGLGVALAGAATVGPVLSTVNVELGPAAGAKLPAKSEAVPAAIEIPSEPLPVISLKVTVRVKPVPVTPTVPLAVPVSFKVMFAGARLMVLSSVSA